MKNKSFVLHHMRMINCIASFGILIVFCFNWGLNPTHICEQSVQHQPPHVKKICTFTPPNSTDAVTQPWFYNSNSAIATQHNAFDSGLGTALSDFLGSSSVYDIGAGVGQLGVFLQNKKSTVDYLGFDNAIEIQSRWGERVPLVGDNCHIVSEICWINTSSSFQTSLPSRDWVIALEIVQHLTGRLRAQFVYNIAELCTEGVVLSGATPVQNGHGGIIEILHDDIINEMRTNGFKYDIAQSTAFRDSVTNSWWLESSLMVFRRVIKIHLQHGE